MSVFSFFKKTIRTVSVVAKTVSGVCNKVSGVADNIPVTLSYNTDNSHSGTNPLLRVGCVPFYSLDEFLAHGAEHKRLEEFLLSVGEIDLNDEKLKLDHQVLNRVPLKNYLKWALTCRTVINILSYQQYIMFTTKSSNFNSDDDREIYNNYRLINTIIRSYAVELSETLRNLGLYINFQGISDVSKQIDSNKLGRTTAYDKSTSDLLSNIGDNYPDLKDKLPMMHQILKDTIEESYNGHEGVYVDLLVSNLPK
ncbi:hypothetical protein O1C66_000395 [Vibrio cholerae]|nr:hypothetical protein [Vibrio cholerae]